jgi:hypothetical protein
MFCPVEYRESILIFRGLVILVVVVILGVSVTEQQLNSLTQRQEGGSTFSIAYDQSGLYSMHILGSTYNMRAVYSMGEIVNSDKAIIVKTMNHSITIPTYIEIDCKQELKLLDLWAQLVVKEAFKFKHLVDLAQTILQEKIHVYISRFR